MLRIIATALMLVSLFMVAGCVKKKSDDGKDQIEQSVDANYIGQHNGCVQNYDPLFCPEKYAPKDK